MDAPTAAERPPTASRSCLIATSPRTGSWLLAEALGATNVAGHPVDCFQPHSHEAFNAARSWPMSIKNYTAHCVDRATTPNGVMSTTLKWNGFRWLLAIERATAEDFTGSDPELTERLFPQARWIHLHRADTARQAISWYRGIETELWHIDGSEVKSSNPQAGSEPDYARLRWLEDLAVEHARRWHQYFSDHKIQQLNVTYEDLALDVRATVRRVLDYLNLDVPSAFASYQPKLLRQADATTDRWLRAYLERRDSLPPSPWAAATSR
jgi:trehalose 2-sulfotransferase